MWGLLGMRRQVDLAEISDGKLYDINDMVKLGCQDCVGCSACCRGMGESIILDPLDVFRISLHLDRCFEELLGNEFELNVVDGIILPNLKMNDEEACSFLNQEGRCSIHPSRPGICRLFPLGRYYENGDFKYFLQKDECAKKNRTKVKVGKWIDVKDYDKNKQFLNTWHYFLNDMEAIIGEKNDDNFAKQCCLLILRLFYMNPYDADKDFYEQFDCRMKKMLRTLEAMTEGSDEE